jgi:tetratricopeptide (TPR) repeat protein
MLSVGCASITHNMEPPLSVNPDDGGFSSALAQYTSGLLYEADGNSTAALAAHTAAHRLDPYATAPFVRATLGMIETGQTNAALIMARESAEYHKERPEVWALYGGIAEQANHNLEAARAFARCLTLQPDDHDNWEVRLAEIRNLFMAGKDYRAVERLRQMTAITNLPSQISSAPLQWARHFIIKERQPRRSLPLIDLMMEQAKTAEERAATWTFRGDALMLTGKTNQACRSYWAAFDEQPAHNPAVRRLGTYLVNRPNTGELTKLTDSIAKSRTPLSTAMVCSAAWNGLQESDKAADALLQGRQRALQRGDTPPVFYDLTLGAILDEIDRDDEAASVFLAALAVHTNAHVIMNHLAYMWAVNNTNLQEAQMWSEKSLTHEPHNYAYIDTLGWIYYRQGRFHDALNQLLMSARLSPQPDSVIFDHIGDTLNALGRRAEAISFWRQALSIDQSVPDLEEKLKKAIGLILEEQ